MPVRPITMPTQLHEAFVNVPVPELIYQRLERTAERLEKPVETLLAETLSELFIDEDEIPLAVQQEVEGLQRMEVSELSQIAHSEMIVEDQRSLDLLLDLQGIRPLSDAEEVQMESLRSEYGRVLLRKARALALLVERGQPLPFALPS